MLKDLMDKKVISAENLGFIADLDNEIKDKFELRLKEIEKENIKS